VNYEPTLRYYGVILMPLIVSIVLVLVLVLEATVLETSLLSSSVEPNKDAIGLLITRQVATSNIHHSIRYTGWAKKVTLSDKSAKITSADFLTVNSSFRREAGNDLSHGGLCVRV